MDTDSDGIFKLLVRLGKYPHWTDNDELEVLTRCNTPFKFRAPEYAQQAGAGRFMVHGERPAVDFDEIIVRQFDEYFRRVAGEEEEEITRDALVGYRSTEAWELFNTAQQALEDLVSNFPFIGPDTLKMDLEKQLVEARRRLSAAAISYQEHWVSHAVEIGEAKHRMPHILATKHDVKKSLIPLHDLIWSLSEVLEDFTNLNQANINRHVVALLRHFEIEDYQRKSPMTANSTVKKLIERRKKIEAQSEATMRKIDDVMQKGEECVTVQCRRKLR